MDKHLPNEKTTEDLFADTENTWDYEDDEEGELSGEKFNYHFVIGICKQIFCRFFIWKMLIHMKLLV